MPFFRNASDQERFIPKATPTTVPPDGVFEVPDDQEAAFERSPHFKPATGKKTSSKASTGKGDDA